MTLAPGPNVCTLERLSQHLTATTLLRSNRREGRLARRTDEAVPQDPLR